MVKMIISNQYDALGQRICKIDSVASNTTLYYYNDNWQVLAEYNTSGTVQSQYIYGNYIDEVLFASTPSGLYYYAHDHLYSPAALLSNTDGSVLERYEYDAYGKATVYTNMSDWDTSTPTTQSYSVCANPYTFTGRRLDTLDSGDYEIMYYRNRYYDTETGRFLQHDQLGVRLTTDMPEYHPIIQFAFGINIYSYALFDPIQYVDFTGEWPWSKKPKGTSVKNDGSSNTIHCKGGKLEVHIGNKGSADKCTTNHEESHIKDWKKFYGKNVCKGVPDGYLPVGGKGYDDMLEKSECKAYKIGKKCRDKLMKCASPSDVEKIKANIARDEKMIKKYCK